MAGIFQLDEDDLLSAQNSDSDDPDAITMLNLNIHTPPALSSSLLSHIVQIHEFTTKDTLEATSSLPSPSSNLPASHTPPPSTTIANPSFSLQRQQVPPSSQNDNPTSDTSSTDIPRPPLMARTVSLKSFDLISVIGKGAYGKVFLVRKRGSLAASAPFTSSSFVSTSSQGTTTEGLYDMKVLRKAHIVVHKKDAEHTRNERSILESIQHPFIVKLFYAFQTSSKLYLILSFAPGGELFTYLSREKMFSEPTTTFYTGELLLALEHLHSLGIIYRDLKPENVLLNQDGHIMLTDFGLSKVALDARTVCGTYEFMAPEIIQEKVYDRTVDFWSLGIMIYDMLTGGPPFTGNNTKKIQDAILHKKLMCPKYMTPFAKDICTKMLRKNPAQRLGQGEHGAKEIKQHAFFRKIDWKKLANRECVPPIQPNLKSPEDLSCFSEVFTNLPPVDTPPNESSLLNQSGKSSLNANQLDDNDDRCGLGIEDNRRFQKDGKQGENRHATRYMNGLKKSSDELKTTKQGMSSSTQASKNALRDFMTEKREEQVAITGIPTKTKNKTGGILLKEEDMHFHGFSYAHDGGILSPTSGDLDSD